MKVLKLKNRTVKTDLPAFVMGIVNCTPDSFYKNSRMNADQALKLIDEGADILDIGGESTRPDSVYVDEEEEIKRIIPVIKEIRKHSDIPVSVDTRKKSVFKAAVECGADMLNDISALEDDRDMADYVSQAECSVVLMHKRGSPLTMQKNTQYKDVFSQVNDYLGKRVSYALSRGIKKDKIILDPGIGFGKGLKENKTLIARCGELCNKEYPVLMALSRKSCIGEMTGSCIDDRLYGTLAADMIAVLKGAFMLRVHDVKACCDTLKVLKSFMDSGLLSDLL